MGTFARASGLSAWATLATSSPCLNVRGGRVAKSRNQSRARPASRPALKARSRNRAGPDRVGFGAEARALVLRPPSVTGVDCARISVRLRCLDVHRVNQWAHVNKLGV